MTKRIRQRLAKIPLLLRVVSLYVGIGSAIGLYGMMMPSVEAAAPVHTIVTEQVVAAKDQGEPAYMSGLPRRIELPRIGLVRAVTDGYYDAATQSWTLADDKVQYATMTRPANDEAGQTVLYGHNTSAVLEPVRLVRPGDELLVSTDNGHIFVYTYTDDTFVVPTDVSVLEETPKTPRIVLMTCEGWLSTTRRLLYFDFKEVR